MQSNGRSHGDDRFRRVGRRSTVGKEHDVVQAEPDERATPNAATVPGGAVLERETERALLNEVARAACDGQSGVLVVRGEAGIGKTTLLDQTVAEAKDMCVATLAGIEAEMTLSFAA